MSWLEQLRNAAKRGVDRPEAEGGTVLRGGRLPAAASAARGARFGANQDVGEDLIVRSLLGAGAMGEVYLAQQRQWNVEVALKVPNDEILADADNRHRIIREAEAWTDLGLHPNIAYCYYAQALGNLLLLVIEYVDGGNLRDWIAAGRCADLKTGLDLAIQFCHGLEHAHLKGLVHRDIKPENILLMKDGTLKITDFGIVRKALASPEVLPSSGAVRQMAAAMTVVGIGTPDYMAPEQRDDQSKIDGRADIFAFGVCLYEMMCGVRPYRMTAGPRQEAPEPGRLRGGKGLPERLCLLMRRCVDWDRDRRPSSAAEVRTELCAVYAEAAGRSCPHAALPKLTALADDANNRALSYLALGRAEDAEKAWQAALTADPQHPEATYNYGLHRWRSARMTDEQLVFAMREVITADDSAWLPKCLLAQVHLERGDAEGAQEVLASVGGADAGRDEILAARKVAASLPAPSGLVRTLPWHFETIAACLSADGHFALLGRPPAELEVWDIAAGVCLRVFKGHSNNVVCASLSGDGRLALSGSMDNTIRVWDVATGRCLRILKGHSGWVHDVHLSRDARLALSDSSDSSRKLWDVATGACLRTFEGVADQGGILCLSADGRGALLRGKDKTMKLWSVETGSSVRDFEGHADGVVCAALSADGRLGLTGSTDNTLKLWELATGNCLRTFAGHTDGVWSACLSADGRLAISGSKDKTVKLWDLATGRCLGTFEGHAGAVSRISLSSDARFALSFSQGEVVMWDVGTRRRLQTVVGHSSSIRSVCMTPDARLALSGSWDKTLKLWEMATGRCLRTLEGHSGRVDSVCVSADGRKALSGSEDKTLKLWDLASGVCVRSLEGASADARSVCLSADARFALTSHANSTMKFWELASGRCLRVLEGHRYGVSSMSLSADGRLAFSGGSELKLWDTTTGECLRNFKKGLHSVESVTLSADGRFGLSGDWETVKYWDVAKGLCLRTFEGHRGRIPSICLSADGRWAVSGSEDGTLRFWDVASGRCRRTLEGHRAEVSSVFLSADAHTALSFSKDESQKLWRIGSFSHNAGFRLARPGYTVEITAIASRHEAALADARRAISAGDPIRSCRSLQVARQQPGYRRAPQAIAEWRALYSRLRRRRLVDHWLQWDKPAGSISCLAGADARQFISGTYGGEIELWDASTGVSEGFVVAHQGKVVRHLDVNTGGRFALTGSQDKTLKLFELASGTCLRTFAGHNDEVHAACLSADGRFALSGSNDKTMKLWHAGSGRCLRTFEAQVGAVRAVCLSPDGRHALSGSDDGIKLWDVASGRCLRSFGGQALSVHSLSLSADGRYLLSGGYSGTLMLWDVATGVCLRTFEGYPPVYLGADGRFALSVSADRTVKFWDVETGRCLCAIEGRGDVRAVYLTADAQFALARTGSHLSAWFLDWELEEQSPADWDEGARPYLEVFLRAHRPYAASLPEDRQPTDNEVTRALTRRGRPTWSEDDFKGLLSMLGCTGYGWLRPEGVRHELQRMTPAWKERD